MGFYATLILTLNFPSGSAVKNLPAGDLSSVPGLGRSLGGRAWQPTSVFVSGQSHGLRSLMGYSPNGHKEAGMAKATEHTHAIY